MLVNSNESTCVDAMQELSLSCVIARYSLRNREYITYCIVASVCGG